jgi:hypothetical protein
MRDNGTSHLSADLAQLYDGLQALRAEVARRELTLAADAPERAELRASAEGIDADLETLRNPGATADDLEWVQAMWADIDPASPGSSYWAGSPVPAAEAAEAGIPEMEPEAAL